MSDSGSRGWISGGVLALLALLVVIMWAFASPPGSSPDDDFHLGSIWCAWGVESSGCAILANPPPPERLSVSVTALAPVTAYCAALHPDISAACSATAGSPLSANNGGYPDGFYSVMRLAVVGSPQASVIVMRILAGAVAITLLVLAGIVSHESDRWRLWFYWIVGSVPLWLFIMVSTNPSGPALVGVAAALPALIGALRAAAGGRPSWPASALSVVAVLVALASRPDALYFCALALVCSLTIGVSRTAVWQQLLAVAPASAVLAVAFATRDSGYPLPGATAPMGQAPTQSNVREVLSFYVGEFATRIGYLDTSMPSLVWGCMALAMGAILAFAFGAFRFRRFAAFTLAIGAAVTVPLLLLEQYSAAVGGFIQPRYVLPIVAIVLAVSALHGDDPGPIPNSRQLLWVAVLASIAHSVALHTLLRRYITGTDVVAWNLNEGMEWWWGVSFQPMTLWILGTLAFGALATMVALRAGAPSARSRGIASREMKDGIGSPGGANDGAGHAVPAVRRGGNERTR